MPKKVLCKNCGTVSVVSDEQEEGDWLKCILLDGFEWYMPAGVIGPDVPVKQGKIDYEGLTKLPMTAKVWFIFPINQKLMTRKEWIDGFNEDPATALAMMRARMTNQPNVIHIGR
ncbi:MAG TPA: hypothetical protein VMY43_12445 [Methanothrix sp.]|nr:hypothetical protein [Methanothrix sp.]